MNENETDVVATVTDLTVGEILRNARTTGRRKREILTIAKQLCIREDFLTALEEGNYTAIPETVYILGFARNYAMELGLDPDEIVTKIKQEMGLAPDCVTDDDIQASACNVGGKKWTDVFARMARYVSVHWKWFTIGAATVVVLTGIVFGVVAMTSNASEITDTDVVMVAPTSEPKYAVAVRERFGTENASDARVILQATAESSWVKVEDARGRTAFSRVLTRGDVYYVPADGDFKATFGNAGGIDIWVDGKLVPDAGADNVRKSGISLSTDALVKVPAPKNEVATE